MGMPFMFSFDRKQRRRGSKVKIKRIGDNGHPCLVPFRTLTFAVGVVYKDIIKFNIRFCSPRWRKTAPR